MKIIGSPLIVVTLLIGSVKTLPAHAAVPITIAQSGHATVPVTGEFGTRQFVFDTGAEGTAVYTDFADTARLPAAGTEPVQGQTGVIGLPLVELRTLMLDGVRRKNIKASKLPSRADGVPLAGIVGLDVFGDRTIDFDFPRKQLSLYPPGPLPGVRSVAVQGTSTIGGLLTIPVTVGGVVATAVIDTGARKTRFNWALGKQLGWNAAQLSQGDTIQGATNDALDTRTASVPVVTLGTRRLTNLPVLVADLPVFEAFGVADRPAIILGLDWLESTRLVIDFPAKRVWFEPSP